MSRRKRKPLKSWQIIIILIGLIIFMITYPNKDRLPDIQSIIIFFLIGISFLVLVTITTLVVFKQKEKAKIKALEISDVDKMSGIEFEKYVGKLLLNKGYKINYTNIVNDYGADIIAAKNKVKYAVQLKRYSKPVGRSAVSDAVAAIEYYRCNKAMVVTNNYFTKNAKKLARLNNCILIDRDKLATWIIEIKISR